MLAPSYPPCIDPEFAGKCTVKVLEDYRRMRRNCTSETTITSPGVALAMTTLLPALEYAARLGMARWQEQEERHK